MDFWRTQTDRLRSRTPLIGRWQRRSAVRALAQAAHAGHSPPGEALADACTNPDDEGIRSLALAALRGLSRQTSIDAVCGVWQRTRHPDLADLLRDSGWVAGDPSELQVLSALLVGRPEAITGRPAEVAPPLVAACSDADPEIAGRAAALVREARDPDLRDALCDALCTTAPPTARAALLEAGYLPRDPVKRALFLFLTDQWERYEALDFDHRLLRVAHEGATPAVRQQIAVRIRQSGHLDWIGVLQGGAEKRRLKVMSETDWETVLTMLLQAQRFGDLWTLLFQAPPHRSVQILRALEQHGYRPAREDDRAAFARLRALCPAEAKPLFRYNVPPTESTELQGSNEPSPIDGYAGHGPCQFTADGSGVFTVSHTTGVRLRHVATGEPQRLAGFPTHHVSDCMHGVAISQDATTVTESDWDRGVWVWSAATGGCHSIGGRKRKFIHRLAMAADGRSLAFTDSPGGVGLWDPATGERLSELGGVTGWLHDLAFSPDSELIVAGAEEGSIHVWRANGQPLWQAPVGDIARHRPPAVWVSAVAFSPDSRVVAAGGGDGTVRIWEAQTGRPVAAFGGHYRYFQSLVFSPDGARLADLHQIQEWTRGLQGSPWVPTRRFTAALLEHRFRFDVEIGEVAGRLFAEFDIEIEEQA